MVGDGSHRSGCDHLVHAVQQRPFLAYAIIQRGPDVVTTQVVHQIHLRRPRSDATHLHQFGDDLLIAHVSVSGEMDYSVQRLTRKVAYGVTLGARQSKAGALVITESEHSPRVDLLVKSGDETTVDRRRGFPGVLLVDNGTDQGWITVCHRIDLESWRWLNLFDDGLEWLILRQCRCDLRGSSRSCHLDAVQSTGQTGIATHNLLDELVHRESWRGGQTVRWERERHPPRG